MTELVFEVAHARCPLSRLTRDQSDLRVVSRVETADGEDLDGVIVLTGDAATVETGAKVLLSAEGSASATLASNRGDTCVLRMTWPPDAPVEAGLPAAVWRAVQEGFGREAVLEPLVMESGHARARAVIGRAFDAGHVIRQLQVVQQWLGAEHFRVIRVNAFAPGRYSEVLGRILHRDDEELLRLALDLGHYDSPKRCTLKDIATHLGLSVSPVHKRLKHLEQVLVTTHLDPTAPPLPTTRRRRQRWTRPFAADSRSGPQEIVLRFHWPNHAFTEVTSAHKDARVLLQPLTGGTEPEALLVLTAAPAAFIDGFTERPDVAAVTPLAETSDDASFRVRFRDVEDASRHPFPFPRILERTGAEAFLKPVLLHGKDAWLRVLVLHDAAPIPAGAPDANAPDRIVEAIRAGPWKDVQLLALRDVAPPGRPSPPKELERLTPRQGEILRIAYALGYYKTPRACTLGDVARTLGISANAIHKNLTAAEHKIMRGYFTDLG